jgi:hypothetical protein
MVAFDSGWQLPHPHAVECRIGPDAGMGAVAGVLGIMGAAVAALSSGTFMTAPVL